ncbi:hypothetical protein BH11CYA1_BH11CYA1_01700 [soil metagenome]
MNSLARKLVTGSCALLIAFAPAIAPTFAPSSISPGEWSQAAYAAVPVDDEVIMDDLANEILRKEIDLERYYLKYRVEGTKEPKYRRARYFAFQVSSAMTSLASNITNVALSASHTKTPETISVRGSQQGLRVGLVGIALDGGSSAIELCSNGYTAIKHIRNGTSPGAAVKNVVARIKTIDSMIAQREAILNKHPELEAMPVYRCESRVLKSFRDWCLSEFADVYADVKSTQASFNVYYILDIIADCSYTVSQILAIKSLTRPELGNASANTGLVGDSFGILSAPASAKSYNIMYRYWRKRLSATLQEDLKSSEKETKAAMGELNKELASRDASILEAAGSVQNRISVYLLWSARYDKFIEQGLIDQRYQNKVALQGVISGPAISGTYLAQDIMASVALNRLRDRPKAANNLYMAGGIASTAGSATSLALTNYLLFDQLCYQKRMRAKNLLPEQLLSARLITLDELDQRLKAADPLGH